MGRKAILEPFRFMLDLQTGVPAYRQLIDQVMINVAAGALKPGDQLPTVRQVAVDLAINPNTVMRAYREMEIRGILDTYQGTGTFISEKKVKPDEAQRSRRLAALVADFAARVGGEGFTLAEAIEQLKELQERGNERI